MAAVRWGLIGCGDIARKRVAPALRDSQRSQLETISCEQAGLLWEFAEEFGASRTYANWRELVADYRDRNRVRRDTRVSARASSHRGSRGGEARSLRKADGAQPSGLPADDRRLSLELSQARRRLLPAVLPRAASDAATRGGRGDRQANRCSSERLRAV